MKNVKKWVLILCLAGPAVTTFACSGAITRALRDAALQGAAAFVEQTTFDFLDANTGFLVGGD